MREYFNLIAWEISILHKSTSIFLSLLITEIFIIVITAFIISFDQINITILKIIILINTVMMTVYIPNFITQNMTGGWLEQLIVSFPYEKIILVKKISIFIINFIVTILTLPFIALLYNIPKDALLCYFINNIVIGFFCSSLIMTLSLIKLYFNNNNEFISILLIPILIPVIICSSLSLEENNLSFMMINLGISLIVAPISFFSSIYLLKHLNSL